MILNDIQIQSLQAEQRVLEPFEAELIKGGISYGLSSFGYDIRLGTLFRVPKKVKVVDPKKPLITKEVTHTEPFILAPNSWILGHSVETINMPLNALGLCIGKSTYARVGVFPNITPLEPGWSGTLTIEIANLGPSPVRIYPGEGIAQLIFFEGHQPSVTYKSRQGKYQNQTGVTSALTLSK